MFILSYIFSRSLSLIGVDSSGLYGFALPIAFMSVLCISGWIIRKKSGVSQKLLRFEWLATVTHLGLYGILFIAYGKFETFHSSIAVEMSDYFTDAVNISFLNRFFIFILALITAFAIPAVLKSDVSSKYLRGKSVIWLGLVSLYSSFACFGDRLFFRENFGIDILILFILGAMWIFPILLQVLYLFHTAASGFRMKQLKNPKPPRNVRLILFAVLMFVWLAYLIACNPANMSPDSHKMWNEAVSGDRIGYLDFSSLLIVFVRILAAVIPHPSFVAFAQIALMSGLFSSFLTIVYKRGVSLKFLCIFSFVWAALPSNGIMAATLWSNIPYTLSLMLLTIVIYEVISCDGISIITFVKLIFALPLVYSLRPTGFLPAILAAVFIIIYTLKKQKKIRASIAVALACFVIYVIQGPIYHSLTIRGDISEGRNAPAAIPLVLFDGMRSVLYHGGELAPETDLLMKRIMQTEDWKNGYDVYQVNPIIPDPHYYDGDSIPSAEIFLHYMKSFAVEPLIIIQNRLNNTDLLWDVTQPIGSKNEGCFMTVSDVGNSSGFQRTENVLTRLVSKLYHSTLVVPPLNVMLYRAGIYMILSMLLCVYLCANHLKKYMLLFLPLLGEIAALFISMGWPSFRNVWPVPVITVFLILLAVSPGNQVFTDGVSDAMENIVPDYS